MSTQTDTPAPISRLARIGFGLPSRSNSATVRPHKNKEGGADEEWYIPYNGPYEAPREDPRKRSERDSWGDMVLEKAPDDDTALPARRLPRRHTAQSDARVGDVRNRVVRKGGSAAGDNDKKEGTRARSQSNVSGRTVSSGTADHSHSNTTSQRRGSTVSSTHRPPVASYINLDASGGVGESPMPQNRGPQEGSSTHRSSLFSFGGQVRKGSSISRKLSRTPRSSSRGIGYTVEANPGTHRRSSSTGSSLNRDVQPVQPRRSNTVQQDPPHSLVTDNEDLYNSYYATLVDASKHAHSVQARTPSTEFSFQKTHAQHPYAQATNKQVHKADLPHLTFTDVSLPPKTSTSADAAHPSAPPVFPGPRTLKNSVSTPDLRIASNLPLNRNRRLLPKPNSFKDRWLSPETWCDAVLFPRPRLKLEGELDFIGSERIVSPPGSPIPREFARTGIEPQGKGKGVASRVLVHSRSLADLVKVSTPDPSSMPSSPNSPQTFPTEGYLAPPRDSPEILRPPRPKSFAHDDISLVPSVARVLEEGQLLDDQRNEWRAQATQSFQNKLSRSISRSRSKSLTQRGQRKDELPISNVDFLATRACLGNQSVVPSVSPPLSQAPSSSSRHGSTSRGTFGRVSHSQSNSLSKTLSKSSKSHSQRHSRTDSWGKSALKAAKSAACGRTSADIIASEATAEVGGLESVLKKDETKVIRLADPAHIPVDKGEAVDDTSANSKPPVPPDSTDVMVGIALSTPPDDPSEPISLPGHPYAQGGLFRYKTHGPSTHSRQQGSDYAGPHPSLTAGQPSAIDVSSRHRNPPQAAHPYARISRDSFFGSASIVPHPRSDSDVLPPAKMWAQWSPGVIREILPSDIQYSPYLPDTIPSNSKTMNDSNAVTAYAPRRQRSKDSGLGTSEDHTMITEREFSQRQALATAKRIHRKPVRYDDTYPLSLTQSQKPSDSSSSYAAPSSPLEPSAPLDQRNVSTSADDLRATTASPGATSASSSPPRLFGSLDDLDSYRDLFYKSPRGKEKERSDEFGASGSFTWEGSPDRRGSGLTSLARQLSQEFHQIAAERESYYSHTSTAGSQHSAFFRRPEHPGLEFVFEEVSQSESQGDALPTDVSSLAAFHPSVNIPEDVSRSSLEVDPDEDETEMYRVGFVESSLTPPATASDRRLSLTGDMSFAHEQLRHSPDALIPEPLPHSSSTSGLQPTSANPTRSSYLTTSSASRISGLSDFPAPPKHTSLLSSFFDEALSQRDSRSSPPPSLPSHGQDNRLTFDGSKDIEELVTALSSQESHTSHTHTYTQHP